MSLGGGPRPVVVAIAVMAPPVLRLLCVHGYRQDSRSFRERTGSLRKALRKHAELLYVSSPLRVPLSLGASAQPPAVAGDGTQMGETKEDGSGWWFSNPAEDSFNALDHVESCKGLEESLETISKAMAEIGPFDGIMGFSQGAALVAMVCALKQKGDPRFQFDFAILVAGFKSRCKLHEHFYQEPIAVPSLHVFGDTDRVIPGQLSQDLSTSFINPVILTHSGGHFVPVAAAQKLVYLEFLERFQKK